MSHYTFRLVAKDGTATTLARMSCVTPWHDVIHNLAAFRNSAKRIGHTVELLRGGDVMPV